MQVVDEANAIARLRDLGWLDKRERASVRTLAGGVSNCVNPCIGLYQSN